MATAGGSQAKQTSLTLLQRLRKQDPDSWERFARIYAPRVYFWASQMGLRDSDCEDIVQEVFQRVHRGVIKFDRRRDGSFRKWLKEITLNLVRDHFSSRSRYADGVGGTDAMRLLHELPEETPEIEKSEAKEIEQLALKHLDLGMSPRDLQVVERRCHGGLVEDVAAEFDLTPARVYKIWSIAKGNARKLLEDMEGDLS